MSTCRHAVLALLPLIMCGAPAQTPFTLALPPRATNAPDGDAFVQQIAALDLARRDQAIADAFLSGNAPAFLRRFCPVTVTNVIGGVTNVGTFFAAPDYLAVGSDDNFFLAPVAPGTAQHIADRLGCLLPTRAMVNAIDAAAEVKLAPAPIPPSAAMTTVPVFAQHNRTVRAQRFAETNAHPPGALVAGHQKDVVISARLAAATNKVAIYGWHQTNGVPIQPLYLGHVWWWVDYSQCIRLVSQRMRVNGREMPVSAVLRDPALCGLLSDEGTIANPRYPTNFPGGPPGEKIGLPWPQGFSPGPAPGEWNRDIRLPDGIRLLLNAPAPEFFARDKPVRLILYAVPNGNTSEQTLGKLTQTNDDWHFNIQHIGAQTRWLRRAITNETLVVACLEADTKSWPAWRRQHDDRRIVEVIDSVRQIFAGRPTAVVLASHSGGGSLFFGYLNGVADLPDYVQRVALLDSDYAYDSSLHAGKLEHWLTNSVAHHLCVLAYQDYLARLDGKPFVSEQGGTWGRSHALLGDLAGQFQFTSRTNDGMETYTALEGRIEFWLKENPERKIYHTVQVERNGFIQAILSGTPAEARGYEYFGAPVYIPLIQ